MSFKKRSKIPNSRKKESDIDEDDLDISIISVIKADQEIRKIKNPGITIDSSGNKQVKAKVNHQTIAPKTINNMMESQFASTGGDAVSSVQHEKYMEAYIEEKLGLKNNSIKEIILTKEDKLYRVPDEIKALEGPKNERNNSENLSSTSMTGLSGIAEVALPSYFKMKNISDTEAARKSIENFDETKNGDSLGIKRPNSHIFVGTSTDHIAMSKFFKSQRRFSK